VNTVGLERRGFDRERLNTIESAFRLLLALQAQHFASSRTNPRPTQRLADIRELVEFIESAAPACTSEFLRSQAVLTVSDRLVRWDSSPANGQFRFSFWRAARSQGHRHGVIAIREEASPGLEKFATSRIG